MAKPKTNQPTSPARESSLNALKHGLYARKWINPEEQKLYDALFEEYCDYYKPEGAPEYALVETIVASRVKIFRFHAIEDANLELAQSKATDPQHFLDSLGLDNDRMEKEFAALLCGSYRPPEGGFNHEFRNELAQTPTHEISGWNYVEQNMPLLKEHLINSARKEERSLPEFINHKVPSGGLPPIVITCHKADSDDDNPTTKQTINLKCDQVEHKKLQKYVDRLRFLVGKNYLLLQLAADFHSQISRRMVAAFPTEAKMASLHRAKTTEQKLMTQATGELIELQRRRRLAARNRQSG